MTIAVNTRFEGRPGATFIVRVGEQQLPALTVASMRALMDALQQAYDAHQEQARYA